MLKTLLCSRYLFDIALNRRHFTAVDNADDWNMVYPNVRVCMASTEFFNKRIAASGPLCRYNYGETIKKSNNATFTKHCIQLKSYKNLLLGRIASV